METLKKYFLLICALLPCSPIIAASNNKCGKLQIADLKAWQRESLVYNMNLWNEPIVKTIYIYGSLNQGAKVSTITTMPRDYRYA